MVSASTQFTIGTPGSQQSLQPSLGTLNTSMYPAQPTSTISNAPPAGPGEAAITNVSMPKTVLPGASFQIVCTVATYVYGSINYTVNLAIPQLNISVLSNVLNLSNDAVGTTNFTVNIPAITATGIYTGQLTLNDTTNDIAVATVPITFTVVGGLQPGGPGVGTPRPITPGGPRSALPPQAQAYQGYVFGQRSGSQRHQWDFMPHSYPVAYQGIGFGFVPPSTPPPAPPPAPDPSTLVPTSTDTGLPASTPPPITTTTTPVVTTPAPIPPPVVSTPTPVVTTPTTTIGQGIVGTPGQTTTQGQGIVGTPGQTTIIGQGVVGTPGQTITQGPGIVGIPGQTITAPAAPTTHNPRDWQNWNQRFRQYQDWQRRGHHNRGRHLGQIKRAYQATSTISPQIQTQTHPMQPQQPQSAVILATVLPNGTLHIDAHGFQPMEPVTLDLNIPMSHVQKSTPLMADMTGHLAHDYNMTKPPGKQYIAAVRVTGQTSKKNGFKSVTI